MKPIVIAHSKLKPLVLLALCVVAAQLLPAQTLTVLKTFCLNGSACVDGSAPQGPLVQGINGDLYGSAGGGGTGSYTSDFGGTPFTINGTVFKIASGQLTTIYNFCSLPGCADGGAPAGGLVQARNSENLYGVTSVGGAHPGPYAYGGGTIFKITPSGVLTTLYSFCSQPDCADGWEPYAGLVQASNGDYYGTTYYGGVNGGGTIFKITAAGTFSRLYSFCSKPNCADGGGPSVALVQGDDGNLYGTTAYGGTSPYLSTLPTSGVVAGKPGGTVFKITPQGKLTTLYSFCSEISQDVCTDGEGPASLINGIDGNLYGTTTTGGANTTANQVGDGTIYKITQSGVFQTIYNFCSQISAQGLCADGQNPVGVAGELVQASDGNLYGTTLYGGAGMTGGGGTLFKTTLGGAFTTLHDFCADGIEKNGCTDGHEPYTLSQATNGNFYGTALSFLKSNGHGFTTGGEVFKFSVGLAPFVETLPTSSATGASIKILGNNLVHATSVSFNGIAAEFKAVSAAEITATVPAGATSGTVQVITPSGILDSNMPFTVTE